MKNYSKSTISKEIHTKTTVSYHNSRITSIRRRRRKKMEGNKCQEECAEKENRFPGNVNYASPYGKPDGSSSHLGTDPREDKSVF